MDKLLVKKLCSKGLHRYEGRRCKKCAAKRTKLWRQQNLEKDRATKKAYRENNRERFKELQKDWEAAHKDERRRSRRNTWLKKEYGITVDKYDQMFEDQNGRCAICGKHRKEFKKDLAVDHNHNTGRVRQLLCQFCNTAYGFLCESEKLIMALLEYHRKWKE